MEKINKRQTEAFGKKIYLLGKDKYGKYLWLEEGTWDCDWYWGFGYVETYTNNKNPSRSYDIESHTHIDSLIFKKVNNKYIHHWNDLSDLESTVLTESESWEFSDLMKSFYTLKEAAEIYHQGNSHLTSNHIITLKNKEAYNRINQIEIPKIMKRVYQILSRQEK